MMDLAKRLWSIDDVASDHADCEALIARDEELFVIAAVHNPAKVLYDDGEVAWDRPILFVLRFSEEEVARVHLAGAAGLVKKVEFHDIISGPVTTEFMEPLAVYRLSEAAKSRKFNDEIWLAVHSRVRLGVGL